MERKIMIFSDSLRLRRDAWRYAVALTQRLNSELILLLLLSPPVDDGMSPVKVIESISMMNEDARAAVNGYLSSLKETGPALETAVRVGDPHSELVKYLAEASFQALVWGGEINPMTDRRHWLAQVKGRLPCPIIIPRRKGEPHPGPASIQAAGAGAESTRGGNPEHSQ